MRGFFWKEFTAKNKCSSSKWNSISLIKNSTQNTVLTTYYRHKYTKQILLLFSKQPCQHPAHFPIYYYMLNYSTMCVNVPSALMVAMEPPVCWPRSNLLTLSWDVLCWEGKWMFTLAWSDAQIPWLWLEWMSVFIPWRSTPAWFSACKPWYPLWCIVQSINLAFVFALRQYTP